MRPFFIGEAVGFGWKTLKGNFLFFLGLVVLVGLITYVPSAVSQSLPQNLALLSSVITLISWLLGMLISVGLIKVALEFVDKGKSNLSELLVDVRLIIFYFVTAILVALATALGFVLLLVPGIILAIRLQFWPYFLVDKKVGPIEAIKMSWHATKGYSWDLVGFGLTMLALNLLGLLALIVGIAVTAPITLLATAYVYRKLNA